MEKVQRHRFSPRMQIHHVRRLLSGPKRGRVIAALVIAMLCVLVVGVQLLFGATERVRPGVWVAGIHAGGWSRDSLEDQLRDAYGTTSIVFAIDDTKHSVKSDVVGVTPDIELAAQKATAYPLWQRFIPFTLFVQYGQAVDVVAAVDDAKLQEYMKATLVPLCQRPAVNASVKMVDNELHVIEGAKGRRCSQTALRDVLHTTVMDKKVTQVNVPLQLVAPAVSTEKAQQALAKARMLTSRVLMLTLLGQTHQPTKVDIAAWLTFTVNEKDGNVQVGTNSEAIERYLETLQKTIYIAPGKTVVTTVDGKETGRAIGASGRGIDSEAAVQVITSQLLKSDGTVPLAVKPLAPTIVYNRTYTTTEAGLRALVKQLASEGDIAISVRELGGRQWVASSNGDKAYVPASTYKLFVAYAVLKNIESGVWQWGIAATSGKNVSECFDAMIVYSDNACAEWFGETIGWKKITSMIHAVGVSSKTSLYTKNGFAATTDDNALFLAKLQRGELLSQSLTNRLLEVMKRQVYRAGIPAGVSGAVADKVGFLGSYLHDSAIVDTPNGPYVLVIYTKGSSWGKIADMTRQIDRHLRY